MTREDIEKELIFADMVLGAIKNVKTPMLRYNEEKDVVEKALTEYKYKLESEMRGRWGSGMNEMIEVRARWVCCPMCDKKKCDRTADDCDVKLYLKGTAGSEVNKNDKDN